MVSTVDSELCQTALAVLQALVLSFTRTGQSPLRKRGKNHVVFRF